LHFYNTCGLKRVSYMKTYRDMLFNHVFYKNDSGEWTIQDGIISYFEDGVALQKEIVCAWILQKLGIIKDIVEVKYDVYCVGILIKGGVLI